jgi:hypothetical protein
MSTDRHDPLDADEQALARVLRALPAGEPPSTLDARILAMARDAVVSPQRPGATRRTRRAPGWIWGSGVAASCVLAAGLVWRLGGFDGSRFEQTGGESVPMASDAAPALSQPAAALPPAEVESVRVEISTRRSAPSARPAPPPPPPPPPPPAAAPVVAAEHTTAPAPPPAPPPPAPPAPVAASAPMPQALAPEPPVEPSANANAARADAAEAPVRQGLADEEAAAARLRTLPQPDLDDDARLGPQAWIERIRWRLAQGDASGAQASLERFERQYPRTALPADLAAFRDRPR